jgi:DNA-binding NtrC family response regulator
VPELRQRREDIPLLIEHFISKYNRLKQKDIAGISERSMAVLLRHEYPGNVRELENIIEHAFVLCPGGMIEPQHLPSHLFGEAAALPAARVPSTLKSLEAGYIADLLRRHGGNRSAAAREMGIHPSTLFRKMRSLGLLVK